VPDGDLPALSNDPDALVAHMREIRWRLAALDEWREKVDGRVSVLESEIVTEREARRLREALAKHGQLQLTKAQQLAGVLLFVVAVADLIRGLT
jgi:hypothetical protein